jgi:adenosylcobinamide-GDP ribazoletransferase
VTDAVRLAIGTLTAVRVPAPRDVDLRTAGRAMALAPLVGLALALAAEAVVLAVRWAIPGLTDRFLAASLALATLAVLSRGLHLDGLVDTADGLGSGRRGDEAVRLMHRPEVGAFGVVTVALVLLVQVSALDVNLLRGRGTVALLGGVVVSRLALTVATRRGRAAAPGSVLGGTVAGSVGPLLLVTAVALTFGWLGLLGWWEDDEPTSFVLHLWVAAAIALLVSALLVRRCVRRFGGITGDVLGAACEVAFATFVVLVSLR